MEIFDDLQGPRLSFSQDDDIQESTVPEKRKREYITEDGGDADEGEGHNNYEDDGFCFKFSSAMSLDLPLGYKMVSAEELFFNGKLRPLCKNSVFDHGKGETPNMGSILPSSPYSHANLLEILPSGSSDVETERMGHDMVMTECHEEKLAFRVEHSLPMVKTSLHESLAMAKQHLRSLHNLRSLHESPRCLSMTIEGSRGHPRRSCVSLSSSRCSSPSRSHIPLGTFSQPRTTPTSPKASSHKSRRFIMALFKLGKGSSKDSSSMPSSHEGRTRTNKRSFWPFSRSNSAGESKSLHSVFPLPRRSNSAGESKTTSSALLPSSAIKLDGERKGKEQADRNGLPPLPSSNIRRASSCFVPPNCGTDFIALSSPSMSKSSLACPMSLSASSSSSSSALNPTASPSSLPITSSSPNTSLSSSSAIPLSSSNMSLSPSPIESSCPNMSLPSPSLPCPSCTAAASSSSSSLLPTTSLPTCLSEAPPALASSGVQVKNETPTPSLTATPAMHVRHVSAGIPGQHIIARGSAVRQQWSNSNMGSSMRHNVERYGNTFKGSGLGRTHKDALGRDSTNIRVTPILNMHMPSCITPSSKSKVFNLGNLLFTKKEKAAKGYATLVSTDSQDGG